MRLNAPARPSPPRELPDLGLRLTLRADLGEDGDRPRLFSDAHSPWPYYLSGVALARLERLFAEGQLPRASRPSKFQLLMVYRLQNEAEDLPPLNSARIQRYCEVLFDKLQRQDESMIALQRAGELVAAVRDEHAWREPPERTRAFTLALVEAVRGSSDARAATTEPVTGTVKAFSATKGWGFIAADDGSEVFVHYSGIVGEGYRSVVSGQRVRFVMMDTD